MTSPLEISMGTDLTQLDPEAIKQWVKEHGGDANLPTGPEYVAWGAAAAYLTDLAVAEDQGQKVERAVVGETFIVK